MKRRQDYTFSRVPRADIPRSRFSRGHGYKATFDAGWLIPFYVDEVIPGDSFRCKTTIFARLATPLTPLMDNMYVDTFFFFVPNRLLWDKWQRFCGEQPNPGDSTDFMVPQVETGAGSFAADSIFDYMGIPPGVTWLAVNALFPRAYNLVWNEWFRDQNLQTRAVQNVDDGPDLPAEFPLRRRGKRHDYFTSALPWPQKGAGVELPIGGMANVVRDNVNSVPGLEVDDTGAVRRAFPLQVETTASVPPDYSIEGQIAAGAPVDEAPVFWGSDVGLMADLGTGTPITINDFREAVQLQKFLERDARGGTRYVELVKSHFGVTSPDARLQRPEFLGGGSAPVIIHPVASTAEVTPAVVGELAGYGTVQASGHGFSKSFVEHGVILGLVMLRGDLNYQSGINRMWNRRTREDHYWPVLAHLGEQEIRNKEIYAQGSVVVDAGGPLDEQVFGYQERWAEYRYYPNMVAGRFRSTAAGSLDFWHLSQEFSALPTLSETFIVEDPPVDRVVAVPTEPHLLFDAWMEIDAARPMPLYSVPGLVDHF